MRPTAGREPARVEAYCKRFPELAAQPDRLLALIRAEYVLRRRSGPVGMRRELMPYLAVITFSGLVAVGITTGVDRLLGGAIADHALRTAVIAVVYGLSYLPVFVLKFALLDRLVFGIEDNAAARRRRIRDSRNQVPTSTRA